MRDPDTRANSLAELLFWDDAEFVRCAFVTVLGRPADPESECFYTNQVREGLSKRDILWKLRTSGEGRQHDPGIAGFDRALRKAARQRKWQWLYAFSERTERDSPQDRRHRAQLNEMALLRLAQVEQNRLLAILFGQIPETPSNTELSHGPVEQGTPALPLPEVAGRRSGIGQSSRERYVLDLLKSGIEDR